MATSTLQPYELDIHISWKSIPSRADYLAAKVRAWDRDAANDVTSMSAKGMSKVPVHVQREFVCPPASAVCSLHQRWSFFRELAACEMEWHGLTQRSWTIKYDHSRARAGMCDSRAKVLSFSRHLIARGSPRDMRETLLHEIAHALAGSQHGHDLTWRSIAQQIGCSGERCHHIELVAPKWIFRCSAGCWQVSRHRRRRIRMRSSNSDKQETCRQCQAVCEYVAI